MDQALASLRIETSPFKADRYANRIRLSRACGLKQNPTKLYCGTQIDQALASLRIETNMSRSDGTNFKDQALASLRIETEKNVRMCGRRRDQALASLRFEVSVLKFTQSRPAVGVKFPKI